MLGIELGVLFWIAFAGMGWAWYFSPAQRRKRYLESAERRDAKILDWCVKHDLTPLDPPTDWKDFERRIESGFKQGQEITSKTIEATLKMSNSARTPCGYPHPAYGPCLICAKRAACKHSNVEEISIMGRPEIIGYCHECGETMKRDESLADTAAEIGWPY